MKFRLAGIKNHSSVDGPGIRLTIFFQGCKHKCNGCHNKETWDLDGGEEADSDNIINIIQNEKFIDGVTFSGGDPFFQLDAAIKIAKEVKSKGINLWCYTGFTFEEIMKMNDSKALELLSLIDTLVDGRFVLSLKSSSCLFRGSTNQRLIDVKESLKQKNVIEQKEFDFGL